MLLATIDISWKAQDIVNVFIEVVTLIFKQNPEFFIIVGVIIVIGAFLLFSLGVCCGMCCFECTKRQSKICCSLFWAGPCYEKDDFDIETGGRSSNNRFDHPKYVVRNGEVKKQNHIHRSSEYLDGINKGHVPV